MVRANFTDGNNYTEAPGLTQWDYGQVLEIHGLDLPKAVEIHFAIYDCPDDAIIRIGNTIDKVTCVVVPEKIMEQPQDAVAYVYVSDTKSGETVRTVYMPMIPRQKPEAFDAPEDAELFKETIETVNAAADRAELAKSDAETARDAAQSTADGIRGDVQGMVNEAVSAKNTAVENANISTSKADETEADRLEVEALKSQAQTAAESALLSEQNAKASDTAAQTAQAGAETAEGQAELFAGQAEESKNFVEAAKAVVMELGQKVADDKSNVEQAVSDFEIARQNAFQGIKDAENAALKNIGTGIDDTLTQSGKAAGAKATGDKLDSLKDDISDLIEVQTSFTSTRRSKIDIPKGATFIISTQDGSNLPDCQIYLYSDATGDRIDYWGLMTSFGASCEFVNNVDNVHYISSNSLIKLNCKIPDDTKLVPEFKKTKEDVLKNKAKIEILLDDVSEIPSIKEIANNSLHRIERESKNLFNPSNNIIGFINVDAFGDKQTVDNDTNYVTQKIKISNENDYTFSGGIRAFSLVNEDNIIVKAIEFISNNSSVPYTLNKTNIPQNTQYLYVSMGKSYINTAQVEKGAEATPYVPYGTTYEYSIGSDIIAKENMDKLIKGSFSEDKYIENDLVRKNECLIDELNFILSRQNSLYDVKNSTESEPQNITLKDSINSQKMILHLHRYANGGFDTINNVFLPHARKDFKDIRIGNNEDAFKYHVNRVSNIDVVEDSRIKMNGMFVIDSHNNMISSLSYISKSTDGGRTWEDIPALKTPELYKADVLLFTNDDSILVGAKGKIYKATYPYENYKQVLDMTTVYPASYILPENIAKMSDGSIIFGAYQEERSIRLYKSKDNGDTWNKVYDGGDKYQHVHKVTVDTKQSVETIYVGCDGGGGILKSTDGGNTWIDLREQVPNIPQSTDCGVIYAGNGFRLLGGETAIVGGCSIIRTEDDATFVPVLNAGNGVYFAEELNGALIAVSTSTGSFRCSTIYVSKDNGLTWEELYTTSPMTDSGGASDGYRYLMKFNDNELIASCQSNSRKPIRITSHDDNVYAEVIVDITHGTQEISVESGYIIGNSCQMFNDYIIKNHEIVHYPLNENNNLIMEKVSGEVIEGNFRFIKKGKHIANIYPYITNKLDTEAVMLMLF